MRLKALTGAFIRSARQEGLDAALKKARRFARQRKSARNVSDLPMTPVWRTLSTANSFFPPLPPRLVFSKPKVALIGDMGLPQCKKYRINQIQDLLGSIGVDVAVSDYTDRNKSVSILQDATHLFEYRLPLTDICLHYRYEARRLGLPILYDIDDPLFSYSAYATYGNMKGIKGALHERFLGDTSKYLEMMTGADVLCVSTPGLRHHLEQLTNRPIYLRRNLADRETLMAGHNAADKIDRSKADDFTISFASGSLGHEYDFIEAADGLFHVMRQHPKIRLIIVGHFPKSFIPDDLQRQTVFHKFSDYPTYLETLAESDCMIMPLADDLFNSCKSAVRAIDAASVSVPALAANIGDNSAVVRDHETGFLINNADEWAPRLEQLYHNRDLTKSLGRRARLNLERNWSTSDAAHIIDPQLISWLKG